MTPAPDARALAEHLWRVDSNRLSGPGLDVVFSDEALDVQARWQKVAAAALAFAPASSRAPDARALADRIKLMLALVEGQPDTDVTIEVDIAVMREIGAALRTSPASSGGDRAALDYALRKLDDLATNLRAIGRADLAFVASDRIGSVLRVIATSPQGSAAPDAPAVDAVQTARSCPMRGQGELPEHCPKCGRPRLTGCSLIEKSNAPTSALAPASEAPTLRGVDANLIIMDEIGETETHTPAPTVDMMKRTETKDTLRAALAQIEFELKHRQDGGRPRMVALTTDELAALASAPVAAEPGGWRPISEAPRDGTSIWAWLNDEGIRKVCWWTAEETAIAEGGQPDDYEGGWGEVNDVSEEWAPQWWLPINAIPTPPPAPVQPEDEGRG